MLRGAFEQIASVNDKVVEPQWVRQWCHFVFCDKCFSHVEHNKQTGKVRTQLLAQRMYHQALLHLTHNIAGAGHLCQEKILSRIASHFYWPRVQQEVEITVIPVQSAHWLSQNGSQKPT